MHGGTYAPLNGAASVAGTTAGLGIAGGDVGDLVVDGHGMAVGEGADCGGHCTREAAAGCNRIASFVSAPLHLTGSIPVVFRPQSQYGLPSSHFRPLGGDAGTECGGSSEQRNPSIPPNPTSICVLQSNHPPFLASHPNQQQCSTSFHVSYCCPPPPMSSTLPSLPPNTQKPAPHYVGVISTAPPPPSPFLPDDVSRMGVPTPNPDELAKPPREPPSTSSLSRTLVYPASRTAGAPGLAVPPGQSLPPLPSSSFHYRQKEIEMTGPTSNLPPGVSTSLLISSGAPPPPRDPELRKNIEVLAQYVAKNGPEFEQRTKSDQARNPKFRFLSGGAPGSVDEQAAEYYKWMKKILEEQAGSCLVQPELSSSLPFLRQQGDYEQVPLPSSPSISNSDMDMEDDFAPPPPPEEHGVSENGDETQPSPTTISPEHRSHSGSSSGARELPPPPPPVSPLPAPLPPMYELSLGSPRKSALVKLTPPRHCLTLVSGQRLSMELDTAVSPGRSQGGVDPPLSSHARVTAHFSPKSPSSAPSSPIECRRAPSSAGSLTSSSQVGTRLCGGGDELPAPSMERKAIEGDGDCSDHAGEEAGMKKAEVDDFARHQEQDWELPGTVEVRGTVWAADHGDEYGLKQADEMGDGGEAGKDADRANEIKWQAESGKCRSRKVASEGVRHMIAGNERCQENVHQEGEKEGAKLDVPSERNRSPDEIRERHREGRRAGVHGPTFECVEISTKSSPPAQTTTNSGELCGVMTVLGGQGGGFSRREAGSFSPVQRGLKGTVAETGRGDEVAGRGEADEMIVGGRPEGKWNGRVEPPEIVDNSGAHHSSAGLTRRGDAHTSGSDEPSWGEKSRGRSFCRVVGRSSSRSDSRSVNSSKSRSPCTAVRSRSPLIRSRSPLRRSRSPPHRRWRGRRSRTRSPRRWRRRSISRSRSPLERRSHSRSPVPRRSRSRSPLGVRSRSRTPAGRRSWSRSPFRGGMRWGGGTPPHRVGGRWGEGGKGGRRGWGASKENVCYNFPRGRCIRGNTCRFVHVDVSVGASDRRCAPERDGGYSSKSRGGDREWERVSREVVDRGRRETSDIRREWNGDKVEGRDSFADEEWRDRRPAAAPREKWGDGEESFEKKSERCGDWADTRLQGGRSEDSARFGKGCVEPLATSPKESWGNERAGADKSEWQHGKAVNTMKEWVDEEGVRTVESTQWEDRLATGGGPAVAGRWAEEMVPYVKEQPEANECGWGNPPPPPPLAMETPVEVGDGQLRHKQWEGIAGNKLGHRGLVTWGGCGTGDSENLNLSSAEGVEQHGSIGVPISLGPSSSDLFAQMPISAVSETRPPGPLSSCTDVPHKSMASDVSVHCGDDNGQAPPQYGVLLPSTSCLQPPSHGGTVPLPIVLIPPLASLPLAQNQLPVQQHVPPLHQMQPLQPHHQVHQHQLPLPSMQQSPVTIRPQQVSTSPLPPPPHVQLRVMHCMQGSPFSTMAPPPPLMQVPPPLPLAQTEGSSWGRLFLPRVPEQQQPPPPPPMYIAQKPVEELYDPLADGLDDGTSLRLPAEEALLKDVMPLSQDGPGSLPAKEWSPPTQLHQGGFRQEAMTEVVTTVDLRVPVEVVKVAASLPTANASAVEVVEAAPGGAITVDTVRSDAISPVALKQKESKGILLLRNSVADVVKELLKPTWKEGHMSREAFKIIARKAVDKVVGAVSPHAVPKNQRGVDAFLTGSRKDKIGKLVQGYVEKYVKA